MKSNKNKKKVLTKMFKSNNQFYQFRIHNQYLNKIK
jgi:hypothetical protein